MISNQSCPLSRSVGSAANPNTNTNAIRLPPPYSPSSIAQSLLREDYPDRFLSYVGHLHKINSWKKRFKFDIYYISQRWQIFLSINLGLIPTSMWKPFLEIWNIACVGKIKWLILCHERWLVTRKGWGCRTGNCAKHGFLSFPVFIRSKNLAASVFSGDLSRRPLVSAHNPHLFPLDTTIQVSGKHEQKAKLTLCDNLCFTLGL